MKTSSKTKISLSENVHVISSLYTSVKNYKNCQTKVSLTIDGVEGFGLSSTLTLLKLLVLRGGLELEGFALLSGGLELGLSGTSLILINTKVSLSGEELELGLSWMLLKWLVLSGRLELDLFWVLLIKFE